MKLKELFNKKSERVLNVYCTAGYPELDSTTEVISSLQEAGADIIEIGLPFSDPLADGPVIQKSSSIALRNGMNIPRLFKQLKTVDFQVKVPLVLMGYLNPVLQYGFEKLCADAKAAGITGLIIPDIPVLEYEKEYKHIIKKHDLEFVFLVTPETSLERVKKLDELSSGFLYAVSSSSITGSSTKTNGIVDYLERLRSLKLNNPVLVGFGVNSKEKFDVISDHANGAIIGSAYIEAIKETPDIRSTTKKFINSILIGAANGT